LTKNEVNFRKWIKTEIPTTVLNVFVKEGIYPNPYFGMNNMKIPDSSKIFNYGYKLNRFSHLKNKKNPWKQKYWFVKKIKIKNRKPEQNVFLNFDGINYRADVWVNGEKVGDSKNIAGMFKGYSFNITDKISKNKKVSLTVLVYPLDFPGILFGPGKVNTNGGATGDIGKNVTMHCSIGWDWMPSVRDRNMGIYKLVYLTKTGPVKLNNPFIKTDLPLPETDSAEINLSFEVQNLTKHDHNVEVKIRSEQFNLSKTFFIKSKQSIKAEFSAEEFKDLIIKNPKLWWPNNYGEPNLYNLKIEAFVNEVLSDYKSLKYGIREVDTSVEYVDGWARRNIFINGEKIHIKGGAWVPDMMLNRNRQRIYKELKLIKNANLNLVRIWGGGTTPDESFFDICDELGLLVWHDFWITGDCQGTWDKGTMDWPLNGELFLENAEGVVKKLRNHPSLIIWTGGNEAHPRKQIYQKLRNQIIKKIDGTRIFLPSSGYKTPPEDWELSLPDNNPSGTYSGGPYSWVDEVEYYEKVKNGEDWLFKNEVGTPSVVPINSARKFISNMKPDITSDLPLLNKEWKYHFGKYEYDVVKRYGVPDNFVDYVQKGLIAGASSYRGIFEAVNSEINNTSGVMLWKLNSAWPEVRWQIYDWFLNPNAGYYFIKRALKKYNIQMDLMNNEIQVVKNYPGKKESLDAIIKIFNQKSDLIYKKVKSITFNELPGVKKVISIKDKIINPKIPLYFISLSLKNKQGKTLNENLYWHKKSKNYSYLEKIPKAEIDLNYKLKSISLKRKRLEIKIKNKSANIAFFTKASLLRKSNGEEILPVFWSDNYISIFPGKLKTIIGRFECENIGKEDLNIRIEGWNIEPYEVNLESGKSKRFKLNISNLEAQNRAKKEEFFPVCIDVSILKENIVSKKRISIFPLMLYSNNKIIDSTRIGLRKNDKQTVCFLINIDKKGKHRIRAGDKTKIVYII